MNRRLHQVSSATATRFVVTLGLLPIVPATSILGVAWILDVLEGFSVSVDALRIWQGLFSLLWVLGVVLVWRSVVIWTLGRKWLTGFVAVLPFVQVAWAQPVWTVPGCRFMSDELLMIGQHQITAGVWVWLAIWAWWGAERFAMSASSNNLGQRLGPFGKRLIACVGMIPVVFAVFLVTMVASNDFLNTEHGPQFGMGAAALAAVIIWLIIWWKIIAWSPAMVRFALLSALLLMGAPIVLWAVLQGSVRESYYVMLGCLPIIGWGVWMIWTMTRWPLQIALDRSTSGPSCPACGYSLRGLKATRCPECACEPTLDELWTSSA